MGSDRNLHWVADLRALNEAGQEFDILWDKLRVVPLSVIVDKYTIGAPFLARKILKIQRSYSDTPQYFLPRWDGEEFVLHELFEHRLTPRYGLSYYRNGYWWFKNDLYLREQDWVGEYGLHEELRKVPHPCRAELEEHPYCWGHYGLSPNHWITEGYKTYYNVFSPKTIRGPGNFISEYYAITLVQEPGKNYHWAEEPTNIGVFCRATTNSVKYYAVIQWPSTGIFRPPDPDELIFRFGGDVIHSSDLGVSWYTYGWSSTQVWPTPSQGDKEVFDVLSGHFGYACFQTSLVTRSGVATFMDRLEQGVPDFAVQTDDGPNPRGGLFLSEWDTSGAAMAIASLKERCERLPKPTSTYPWEPPQASAYPRPTLTPLPRLTPTAMAEPTSTPQPTAMIEKVVGVTPTSTPSPSTTRTYVPGPAVAPQGKTTHWERYDRWVEGGFAIRVRSEDRTASLAFRCELERDAARWVAIVETSFRSRLRICRGRIPFLIRAVFILALATMFRGMLEAQGWDCT